MYQRSAMVHPYFMKSASSPGFMRVLEGGPVDSFFVGRAGGHSVWSVTVWPCSSLSRAKQSIFITLQYSSHRAACGVPGRIIGNSEIGSASLPTNLRSFKYVERSQSLRFLVFQLAI